jgi:acyl-CoA dehydrogenase
MNAYRDDQAFVEIMKKYFEPTFFEWADQELDAFANQLPVIDQRAAHTDREGAPRLIKYGPFGDDISEVWVNEGYQKTAQEVYQSGIVAYPHKVIPALNQKGNYMYSFAQGYLLSQVEPGFYCPVTLTMAVAYLIDHFADEPLKRKYLPHVIATGETELFEGATFLTERQGGSDVGANETKAIDCGNHYKLYGEKYFASNAGRCGVATVLARTEGAPSGTKGLSLFLVPWRQEDGTLNGIQIRRLKDKLGVRAVPSAEVIFDGAEAYMIGEAAKGFYYMMEALNLSRVCNAIASIGIMRRAYVEARNYAMKRESFGRMLIDFPLIKETLASLAARQEVETSACFEMVSCFDRVMTSPEDATEMEKALLRLKIALLKIRTATESIDFSHQAIEMHGGNGYIEDFVTPRLLRDAQVLTVWEGPENILCLEVLRLISKFAVHTPFITEMSDAINRLSEPLKVLAEPVSKGLVTLGELIEKMSVADGATQTLYAKKTTHLMADIYFSIVAARDADDTSERKSLIAKIFINHLWNSPHSDDTITAIADFDKIINPSAKVKN